jgi:hypothetical protein
MAEAWRSSSGSPASARWAGTPAATAPTPAAWWPTTAASLYDSDYYGDDLPFWMKVREDRRQRGAPPGGALHAGLQRHALRAAPGLQRTPTRSSSTCGQLRRAVCRGTRRTGPPKMMSIGMHCRLLGRPGRIVALQRFLDHIAARRRVGVPPHRHRAPLDRHAPVSGLTAMPSRWTNSTPRREAEAAHARRPVRTLALDRRRALAQRPVPLARQLKQAMAEVLRHGGRRAAGADPRPPRAGRQGHGEPTR